LAEIAEIRRELEAIDQNNSEMESTNMPDNIDTTLSVEEREIIRKFRESHSSAAEQRARFEKVYNTPCGAWTQADFDWMASLMPALLSGKLPF